MPDRQLSVLLVDDDADVRGLLRMMIEVGGDGLRVVGEAADGPRALELVTELEPDAIVLDQMMPGMSGLAVLEELRRRGHQVAVVLCSAYLDAGLQAAATALGVGECVDKNDIRAVPDALWRVAGPRGSGLSG